MFAAAFGHVAVVKYLIKYFDANPNLKNKVCRLLSWTPPRSQSLICGPILFLFLFLQKRQTALDVSTSNRKREVVDYLSKAVQKKAIEEFTVIAFVTFGIPFFLFVLYRVYQRMSK
jgi:ankyrin repeat protein